MTVSKAGRRYLALVGVAAGIISGFGGTAAAQASHGTQHALVARVAGTISPALDHKIPTPFTLFKSSNPAANGGHPASYAWGVTTLPDGTVAVGDIFNNRVLHYDDNGNLLGVLFTTNGKSGANPYGLAVDPNDWTIYVGSAQCCGVQVYTTSTTGSTLHYTYKDTIDPTGGPTSTTSRYPARVAVGSDGTVYVADMTLDTLSVFSSDATGNVEEAQFGGFGTGPAQFKQPRGMAIGGGTAGSPQRLYVIDSGNYRVQVFDTTQLTNPTTHGYLYSFGSQGNTPSSFGGNLRGLAYDQVNNLIYVVDMGKNHVEEWSINPNATSATQDAWVQNIGVADPNNSTLTTCCARPGDFSDGGREDAVDGDGHLWVADMANFRAQVWSTTTTGKKPTATFLFDAPSATNPQLGAEGAFSYPEGVGVAADGTVVVSDSHNFRLEWFDSATSSTPFAYDTADGGGGAGGGEEGLRGRQNDYSLNYARNISFNTNSASSTYGDFYLADTYNNSVHGFAENGTALWVYGGNGSGSVDGVAVGPANPRIANTSVKSPLALPSGVAVDNSNGPNQGDIYIADSGDKRVVVISPAGVLLGLITAGTGAGQAPFKDPRGLAVDPSTGDLYVADFSGKAIYHFTVTGTWAATGPTAVVALANTITGNMGSPFDIVVDSANSAMYVSNTTGPADIDVFNTATQAFEGSFPISGQPEGIALGPNGLLYVASRSNDQIQVYCNPVTGAC